MSIQINPQSDQFSNQPVQQHSDVPSTAANDTANGFRQVLGGAVQVAGQVATTAASAYGLGPLAGSLNNSLNGNLGDMSYVDLLREQNQLQKESAVFNSMTNISKTEHETRMSAIRNMKS